MNIDLAAVEAAARELYIRALKRLPPDIKDGIARLAHDERTPAAKSVTATRYDGAG